MVVNPVCSRAEDLKKYGDLEVRLAVDLTFLFLNEHAAAKVVQGMECAIILHVLRALVWFLISPLVPWFPLPFTRRTD